MRFLNLNTLVKKVASMNPYRIDSTISRLLTLDAEGITNREIAIVLDLEGHRTLTGRKFTISVVAKILATIRADISSRYSIAARRMQVAAA